MMDSKERYDRLELGIHVDYPYTGPDLAELRIKAENMNYCFLHIPTGEVYVSRIACIIEDFKQFFPDTVIEEWEQISLPDNKLINEMRISQVIF
jgi:hypothetical protein